MTDENTRSARQSADDWEELRPRRRRTSVRRTPVPLLIMQDILLTGLVLVVFALFHHVIPRLTADSRPVPTPTAIRPAETTAVPFPDTDAPVIESAEPVSTPAPTLDPMDWRSKFADKFTDTIVQTESSYTSPNIAITIDKVTLTDTYTSICYVADIYVADLNCFQTYWANGRYSYYGYQSPLGLARDSGGLLTINGDYADNQQSGFLVRNGELYYSDATSRDICVLYYDGTIETYDGGQYSVDEILAREPYQSWKFGPALLNSDGSAKSSFNTSNEISWENPRSALGYYEPGHYCFVVVDGRQSFSRGLTMRELADFFASLGCKAAYNMDGGASAVMTFDQRIVNSPSNGGRDSGDILLIREAGEG